MIAYIIAALFFAAAGVFKAAADLMRNRFDVSIWYKKPSFYDPRISYKRKRIFNYPVDGWHIANSGMIASFCVSAVSVKFTPIIINNWADAAIVFIGGVVVFIMSFNLFYNRVFIRKKYRK